MWIALTLLHKDPGTAIAIDTEAVALWDEEVVNLSRTSAGRSRRLSGNVRVIDRRYAGKLSKQLVLV
jgi:hypothetical protein